MGGMGVDVATCGNNLQEIKLEKFNITSHSKWNTY
jgi:hypothetical protein